MIKIEMKIPFLSPQSISSSQIPFADLELTIEIGDQVRPKNAIAHVSSIS